MNPYRLMLAVVVGCCLSGFQTLSADTPPFAFSKQYSADMVITSKEGQTMTNKIYVDSGKIRTDINANGMQVSSIVRPDLKKVYSVMTAQKMVMEMPYDPDKYKKQMAAAAGPEGKFETVGPESVEGVACTKYKVTSSEGKVVFYWIDVATKAPVKMASEDGSFSVLWKNYKDGAQDAALFEPPADYKVMTMPAMPSAPAGQ